MERRFTERHEARIDGSDETGGNIVHGYGAVFYDGTPDTEYVLWDDSYGRAVERIMPGAFNSALARPDDVRGLFNHDPSHVLGRTKSGTMKLEVDSLGLKYEIKLDETPVANTVRSNVSRGDVSGSSFSFSAPPDGQKWTITQDGDGRYHEIREVTDVVLYDVGPVAFPAYVKTTAGARSNKSTNEARTASKAARDVYQATKRAQILARARAVETSEAV